jgi:hypothetical protein
MNVEHKLYVELAQAVVRVLLEKHALEDSAILVQIIVLLWDINVEHKLYVELAQAVVRVLQDILVLMEIVLALIVVQV